MLVSTKRKTSKPAACDRCWSTDLVRRIAAYPVQLAGPLEGDQIHVHRAALYDCQTCSHLMSTPACEAQIDRNVAFGIRLFLGQLT